MKSTRQYIIEYLQNKYQASATELSHALRLTSADIRHHLSILLKEGVIEVMGLKPVAGRGRPTRLYALSQQALQHNLDRLSGTLLEEIERLLPPAERASALERIAQHLMKKKPAEKSNLSQRLYLGVQQLNEMKYQARWEAHADGPRVIFTHCPYAAILPGHPELCQMDAFLLEKLLISDAKQLSKLELNPQGLPQCIFAIGKAVS